MEWIERTLSGVIIPIESGESKPTESIYHDGLMKKINSLSGVNRTLNIEDVFIRRGRLAGDAIDGQYGRFRTEDLPRLLEMTHGAPMLIGHRRDTLGMARFFGGDISEKDGVNYIRPYFYWMQKNSQAKDLMTDIDGGIYSELSIGFTFKKPTCSICNEDIRACDHFPGENYDGEMCYFYYDNIQRVREGSIVYRGAEPGTGFESVEDSLSVALSKKKCQSTKVPKYKSKTIKEVSDMMPDSIMSLLGLDSQSASEDDAVSAIESLIERAKIGDLAIAEKRESVKALLIRSRTLKGLKEPGLTDKQNDRIDSASYDSLNEYAELYQEQIDVLEENLKVRSSVQENENDGEDEPKGQRVDPKSFKV